MKIKLMTLGLSCFLTTTAFAFPCYITLVKDSCWTNYDVTVQVVDSQKEGALVTVKVPKGKSWTREKFDCQTRQGLNYKATFLPYIWESEKDKVYTNKTTLFLPETISKGAQAWNIDVCYPEKFAEVPLPADATANCKCDFASIPPVK